MFKQPVGSWHHMLEWQRTSPRARAWCWPASRPSAPPDQSSPIKSIGLTPVDLKKYLKYFYCEGLWIRIHFPLLDPDPGGNKGKEQQKKCKPNEIIVILQKNLTVNLDQLHIFFFYCWAIFYVFYNYRKLFMGNFYKEFKAGSALETQLYPD